MKILFPFTSWPEIPEHVGLFLKPQGMGRLACTCRLFRDLFGGEKIFKRLNRRASEAAVALLIKAGKLRLIQPINKQWWKSVTPVGFKIMMDAIIWLGYMHGIHSTRMQFLLNRRPELVLAYLKHNLKLLNEKRNNIHIHERGQWLMISISDVRTHIIGHQKWIAELEEDLKRKERVILCRKRRVAMLEEKGVFDNPQ